MVTATPLSVFVSYSPCQMIILCPQITHRETRCSPVLPVLFVILGTERTMLPHMPPHAGLAPPACQFDRARVRVRRSVWVPSSSTSSPAKLLCRREYTRTLPQVSLRASMLCLDQPQAHRAVLPQGRPRRPQALGRLLPSPSLSSRLELLLCWSDLSLLGTHCSDVPLGIIRSRSRGHTSSLLPLPSIGDWTINKRALFLFLNSDTQQGLNP